MTTIQPGRLDMERKTRTKAPDARDVDVGRRIRAQRLVCRMSQTELANNLGVTFQQVQKYEKGANRVGASRLEQISHILQVPVAFFFEGAMIGSDLSMAQIDDFVSDSDCLRLMRAFMRSDNTTLRRRIAMLVQEIAGDDH